MKIRDIKKGRIITAFFASFFSFSLLLFPLATPLYALAEGSAGLAPFFIFVGKVICMCFAAVLVSSYYFFSSKIVQKEEVKKMIDTLGDLK